MINPKILNLTVLCLMLTAFFFFVHSTLLAQGSERKYYTFDYRPDRTGGLLVHVRLNKQVEANFAVDTGVGNFLLSESLASKLNLDSEPAFNEEHKPIMLNGKQPKMMRVKDTQFGSVTAELPFLIATEQQLVNSDDTPADERIGGILGANLFTPNAVLFDFQKHKFTLFIGGRLSLEERERFDMKNAIAVPLLKDVDDSLFILSGKINDAGQAKFLIDTGSDAVVISKEMADKLKLKPAENAHERNITFGKARFDTAIVASLSFDTLQLKDVAVEYPHKRIKYTTQLGMSILSKYLLLLDYPQRMAYFKPIAPASSDTEKH